MDEQTQSIYNLMELNYNQQALLDLRKSENLSNIKAKTYANKGTTSKVILPNYYRFRLVIYFNNRPNKQIWIPSIDFYKGIEGNYRDEWKGLTKLKQRIKHDYKGKYSTAIIFMSIKKQPDTKSQSHFYPVDIWVKGEQRNIYKGKKIILPTFKIIGKDNFVNLESKNLENDLIKFSR